MVVQGRRYLEAKITVDAALHARFRRLNRRVAQSGISALLATSFGLIGSTPVCAADDAAGAWSIFTVADRFGDQTNASQWRYAFDAQYRYLDRNSGVETLLLRPALGLQVKKNLSLFAGYAYVVAEPFAGNSRDEHRLWQQAAWTAAVRGQSSLTLRTRLEQRWLETGEDAGLRLRQQIRWARPVPGDHGKRLILSLEPFFHIGRTDWGAEPGLAQVRAFIGISLPLNDRLTFETGYAPQWVRREGDAALLNHIVSFNFKI
jgi:hypothetical protein